MHLNNFEILTIWWQYFACSIPSTILPHKLLADYHMQGIATECVQCFCFHLLMRIKSSWSLSGLGMVISSFNSLVRVFSILAVGNYTHECPLSVVIHKITSSRFLTPTTRQGFFTGSMELSSGRQYRLLSYCLRCQQSVLKAHLSTTNHHLYNDCRTEFPCAWRLSIGFDW